MKTQLTSKYLIDIDSLPQYEQLKESFYAVKKDLDSLSQQSAVAKSFNIYDHYRKNPKSGIDPTKISNAVSWQGIFLYHTSVGWTKESNDWPTLTEHLKQINGIVSVQVNFVAPHSVIPMHKDLSNGESCITTILAVNVSPENKFILEDVTLCLKEQDLIGLEGVNVFHAVENLSDDWRVTLVVDLANHHPSSI